MEEGRDEGPEKGEKWRGRRRRCPDTQLPPLSEWTAYDLQKHTTAISYNLWAQVKNRSIPLAKEETTLG